MAGLERPTLSTLVAAAGTAMASRGFSLESADRLADLMDRFARYSERGFGITDASAVTREMAEGFIRARAKGGSPTALATMHLRRSAVRLLFAEGRRLGLVAHDPTLDVVLPPRSSLRARPLTDDEVALCRSYSVRTLAETRQPAAWALAEATARSAEIARIRVRDLDLGRSRVWIPGSTKTEARWSALSGWGWDQLQRRIRSLRGAGHDSLLVCAGAKEGVSATSSASTAIADTLRRAGLLSEPDVRPNSVAAWAGARTLAAGMSIDRVALMVGLRSLDRAAAFVGFDWQEAAR